MERQMPTLYDRKEECCGCTACCAACPEEAIRMIEDEEGFEYPKIDGSTCVRCYKCLKACPIKAAGDIDRDFVLHNVTHGPLRSHIL